MPIYEFECPEHGRFEVLKTLGSPETEPCPKCGKESSKVFSAIGFFRIHHTEKLGYNDSLRVYDRQRMMKDTAVQKALSEYKDKQLSEHQGR